ncbi:hypothetical protein ANRL3_02785 [Anaerolineae bacterium]|nr:hypothetical protein ANRL3_02785 [Anaerolineae bacterium]
MLDAEALEMTQVLRAQFEKLQKLVARSKSITEKMVHVQERVDESLVQASQAVSEGKTLQGEITVSLKARPKPVGAKIEQFVEKVSVKISNEFVKLDRLPFSGSEGLINIGNETGNRVNTVCRFEEQRIAHASKGIQGVFDSLNQFLGEITHLSNELGSVSFVQVPIDQVGRQQVSLTGRIKCYMLILQTRKLEKSAQWAVEAWQAHMLFAKLCRAQAHVQAGLGDWSAAAESLQRAIEPLSKCTQPLEQTMFSCLCIERAFALFAAYPKSHRATDLQEADRLVDIQTITARAAGSIPYPSADSIENLRVQLKKLQHLPQDRAAT